jgi:HD-GYP domain-containing protein (c-di-GMP phosphodiesterase class II)
MTFHPIADCAGDGIEEFPDCILCYEKFRGDVLRDIIYRLPLGVGEKIPFFQCVAADDERLDAGGLPLSGFFHSPISHAEAHTICRCAAHTRNLAQKNLDLIGEVMKYRQERGRLIDIGAALSSVNDLEKLLDLLLAQTREIVSADAGSIYVREREGQGKAFADRLRFRVAQNDSIEIASRVKQFSIDLNKRTIAGYVALSGLPLGIEDVYALEESLPYRFGKEFDEQLGYRTRSMLTIPLKNQQGVVVGVMQLMNRKKDAAVSLRDAEAVETRTTPFGYTDIECISSIASMAAVSIERALLHEDLRQVFEGFLDSSIAAVDERDRVTSGHSRRVMGYATAFADAVTACRSGPYANIRFSPGRRRQFKFAALLHDIGKIGVPERLLNKETRLSVEALNVIEGRIDYLLALPLAVVESAAVWNTREQWEEERRFLKKINSAGVLDDKDIERLRALAARRYIDAGGKERPFLTLNEREALSVRRGNLTPSERQAIQDHALATYRILSKIPWTAELGAIPDIAAHHHEKLDGSGYPDHMRGKQISLESRILAVIDIFEALVSQDRPYKPPLSPEKALALVRAEADAGKLDAEVVDFFEARRIYLLYARQTESP